MILFAKAPRPGRVKTRLAESIGIDQATKLHTAFVADCLVRANELARRGVIDVELHTDVETDAWTSFAVTRRLQVAGDLGARMYAALRGALQQGHPRTVICGTDSPTLPLGHLEELLELDTDVGLGPAEDGGYYAISARRVDIEMFRSVRWSTASAYADTELSCRAAGLSVGRGQLWYDVDELADLSRLLKEGRLPEHTARILENLNGDQGRG